MTDERVKYKAGQIVKVLMRVTEATPGPEQAVKLSSLFHGGSIFVLPPDIVSVEDAPEPLKVGDPVRSQCGMFRDVFTIRAIWVNAKGTTVATTEGASGLTATASLSDLVRA